ncbi:MAG: hypothetical protein FD145_1066 [Candidatus Saganbacteria bacterium]|uniref:PorV/PorQ family protein n=1 Tax=Candidatus Saganbacteria bacterium TaxID=2575572 RepID=A0A833L0N3_UNCSA|nr:MAG: hypothetical protein FD145_1066 [Candidatus Saganbacteria bacterium]
MKKQNLSFIVGGLILLFTSSSFACWGARPMGMGGSFVAVADDCNVAYWNRAGAAQLDNWKDGEKQIMFTSVIFDQVGFFNRRGRVGNPYYDSFSFAQKLNRYSGWTLAGTYNGGGGFAITPGIGFRLPGGGVFDNMSVGIGYYLWNNETYGTINNQTIRLNMLIHQIHLDYLWKVYPEFNFGVHIERFWQISYTLTSPDVAGSNTVNGNIAESMNFRPSIAWIPQGDLKGLIVNAGFYDLFAQGGGPHVAFGFEYTPQPGTRKIVSGKGKSKIVKYVKSGDSFLTNSHFRAGLYNMISKTNDPFLFTLGYGYNISDSIELNYLGGFWVGSNAGGGHNQSFGASWKW